ncbi:TonB-dependent receptor [Cellvibrio sp. PSBB006]|uniref:TonB-dependent receptor n=1 Tax=Cellvibrio sp. PSBB006 TaxID=1987723 RepID=UPI000B3B7E60|nr:TonB-dependent receptor [Cellvibrio sp. PSBB006]ARU26757.1 hypothetical protein CBR65_04545 [Cellvibrio sp. PSBB006]
MLNVKRKLLGSLIGALMVTQANAAAIKLDILVDGKPAENVRVLLDGREVGHLAVKEGIWLENIGSGVHQLEIGLGSETIPVNFSVDETEAAFIAVVSDSNQAKPFTSVQHVALEDVQVEQQVNGKKVATIKTGASPDLATGLIKGMLTSNNKRMPVRNANITIVETGDTVRSDRYGTFELDLMPGVYQLRIEHPDFQSRLLGGVRVLPKLELAVDVDLSANKIDGVENTTINTGPVLEEMLIVATYRPNNPIDFERMSSSVLDSIDFAQSARFDDSMISGAIKRVVGVSLEDDRYAIVRGMKSRYQSTYFDGVILPSTDPGRRDLPLDIFPATIMKGLSLQKTASADVPGNATAGHIDMSTKEVPDEPFFKISYSFGYGDAHTDDAIMVDGGNRDFLGYDDGFRDLPDEAKAMKDFYLISTGDQVSPEQKESLGESFNHYGIYKGEPLGDVSFSLSGGQSWDVGSQKVGVIGAFRYGNKWSNNEKTQYHFNLVTPPSGDGVISDEKEVYLDSGNVTHDTDNVVDVSGMLNMVWELNEDHSFGLNNILMRHTTNSAESRYSYLVRRNVDEDGMPAGTPDTWDYIERSKSDFIDWIEEELISNQVWGKDRFDLFDNQGSSAFFGDLDVDWRIMQAQSEYDRPDAKMYSWVGNRDYDSLEFQASTSGTNYSLWENMEEENSGYRLDLSLPISESNPISAVLKSGLYILERERNGYRYNWRYTGGENLPQEVLESPDPAIVLSPEYIVGGLSQNGFTISSGGIAPEDDFGIDRGSHYLVEQNSDAYYFLADINIKEKMRINIGARYEALDISADQYTYSPEPLFDLLDEDKVLPSITLTYLFNDAWQLRAAYSQTVSWPEVFEVLPRRFRDIENLTTYLGNPDLRPADIDNYDFRLEWYPSDTESVTFALFHKELKDAIENVFDSLGDDYDYYTFSNVESAEVSGWEVDMRREFTFGQDDDHGLFVQFNYTDIVSEVNLPEDNKEYDRNRPLQGQPDYIVNLQIGYDHIDTNQELTLVFNRKGEELTVVTPAVGQNVSNVYAEPFDDLKLIYTKRFLNDLSFSLSAENILDDKKSQVFEFEDVPFLSYEPGMRFKLTADYRF